MKFDSEDLVHVWRLIVNDNIGQKLTRELAVGIEAGMLHYLQGLPTAKNAMPVPLHPEEKKRA